MPGAGLAAGLAAALACFPASHAWGPDGHRIICEIARREMTPETRAEIRTLLSGEDLASACNWADRIKDDKRYAWSRPWHYISTREGSPGPELARDCPDEGCAVSAVVEMVGILRGAPGEARVGRAEALRLLAHIVGDLHQPLHAGHGEDLGGNTIAVTFLGDPNTLHRVWDSGILRAGGERWTDLAAALRNHLLAREGIGLDPLVWARESFRLATRLAYDLPAGGRLDAAYANRHRPVLETRLQEAAVRLAALLDRSLTGDRPPFWVASRRGAVHHYPECAGARRITPRNLILFEPAPASRRLHTGCPTGAPLP